MTGFASEFVIDVFESTFKDLVTMERAALFKKNYGLMFLS